MAKDLLVCMPENDDPVIDWDVRHGNETQSGFYDRGGVLTISMQMLLTAWGSNHPKTAAIEEVGRQWRALAG